MIDDLAALRGGELNAAITSADVRTQRPAPLWTQTGTPFHQDTMVLAVLYDVTIRAEKTLAAHASDDAVTDLCQLLQKTMEADFPNAVERIAGRKVIAFVRGTTFNPDIASELLILGGTLCPTTAGPVAQLETTRTIGGHAALRAGSFRTRPFADTHPLVHGAAQATELVKRVGRGRRWGGKPCS